MNNTEATVSISDLARGLGINQTPSQPLPIETVLIGFAGLDNDTDSVTAEEADTIREAWLAVSDELALAED